MHDPMPAWHCDWDAAAGQGMTGQRCGCLQGQYNKVHVGAACPPDRLASLASLLGPTVTPPATQMLSPLHCHHWLQLDAAQQR